MPFLPLAHAADARKMKTVCFQVIRNYSGADVHFTWLHRGLERRGFPAELRFYPHLCEFLPYHLLRPFLNHRASAPIVHSKAEYGWLFAGKDQRLVVTLAHNVFDPLYERTKGWIKRTYHHQKLAASIRRSFDRADRIVTVSEFSRQSIQEKFGHRDIGVIYEGFDLELFCPHAALPRVQNHPVRLLYVGNLIARKGFPLLVRMMEKLGTGFELAYTSGLRTHALASPAQNMIPLGRLAEADLVKAYNQCDVLVFPSRLEGFGRPVAEAMACAKPVVTTNYASLPELIDDERGGFLCPMDDVDAFVEKIRVLAAHPDLRARMGAYNRAKAERIFSLDREAASYSALYQELL